MTLSHGLLSLLPAALRSAGLQLLLRLPVPEGQRHKQPDGPLRLPGIAGSSSPTALTGKAGKLRRTAMRSGPDGQGLIATARSTPAAGFRPRVHWPQKDVAAEDRTGIKPQFVVIR